MASITVGWTTEKGKLTKIETRGKDDLPKHVTGRAVWVPLEGPKRAYYAFRGDNTVGPVEFINQKWYHIEWFDRQQTYTTDIGRFCTEDKI
jgi:hypothetical protein